VACWKMHRNQSKRLNSTNTSFFQQWRALKTYANAKGIQTIGDIPIFVSLDSADIWTHLDIFQVSSKGKLKNVAGVPPDYFSELGQLWGNPLYDWKALKAQNYSWWMQRLKINFELFDIVRLDHFRGFYDYWEIPADAPDARIGKWAKGPALHFFKAIQKQFPDSKIIAEDLGEEMDEVFVFRKKLGLPGMAILQFAFDGDGDNPYHPENLEANCVVYPGTHDNNTTQGWYNEAHPSTSDSFRRYFSVDGSEASYDLIRCAFRSECRLAVIALQDFMALGSKGRFNEPGTTQGNWQWRYQNEQLERLRGDTTNYLRQLAEENNR